MVSHPGVEKIKTFLQESGMSLNQLCLEAGVRYIGWQKILKGERKLTKHYKKEFKKLTKTINKYERRH